MIGENDPSASQDRDPVGDLENILEKVRDKRDGNTTVAQYSLTSSSRRRVSAACRADVRLVEDQDRGLAQ